MINKRLFLALLAFTLIISLGTIAATDNNNDTTSIEKTTTSTSETTLKTPEPTKSINKQTQPVKEAETKNINNYEELYTTLTNEESENLTVYLTGTDNYMITSQITVNSEIKNLVIEGNGKKNNGKSLHAHGFGTKNVFKRKSSF